MRVLIKPYMMHTANPFPVMKTGFPCNNLLTEELCPAFIAGETYNENRVSLLDPCMGLQYTLFSKMMWRNP